MEQSATSMATRWTVASLLSALALMLAMVLTAAVPALAQQGPVMATGVLGEAYTQGQDPTPTYPLTDEATGTTYVLVSGFVDLDPYVGQRVTIEGVPIGGADFAPPALNVTSIVPVDEQGAPPSVEQTDLVAQLTVECPQNAGTLAGYQLVTTGIESQTAVPLTDEDGDGVLAGTQTYPRFPPGPQPSSESGVESITVPDVRITAPDGSTVQQFGPVKLDQDEILLQATISFCDGGSGSDQYSGGDQYDPGSSPDQAGDGQYDSGSGGTVSGTSSGNGTGLAQLPATGGAMLLTLGTGALLVGGGFLVRNILR